MFINTMKILIIVAKIKSWESSIVFKYNKHIAYCYKVIEIAILPTYNS